MAQLPVYTPEEAQSRETFLALLRGLSYPGRKQALPLPQDTSTTRALAVIGTALLDLETTYFVAPGNEPLMAQLTLTGARAVDSAHAAYQFYPTLKQDADLTLIEPAPIGDMQNPDKAATLIIGCQLAPVEAATSFTLTGPGIQTQQTLDVAGIAPAFWALRQQRFSQYPLGWDVFLVAGSQVVGLPRTTIIGQEGNETP